MVNILVEENLSAINAFSGERQRRYAIKFRRFGDYICLHNKALMFLVNKNK
jgi:hypothetical protein